jgi:hypothetical protein
MLTRIVVVKSCRVSRVMLCLTTVQPWQTAEYYVMSMLGFSLCLAAHHSHGQGNGAGARYLSQTGL